MVILGRSGPVTPPNNLHLLGILIQGIDLNGGQEVYVARQSGLGLALPTFVSSLALQQGGLTGPQNCLRSLPGRQAPPLAGLRLHSSSQNSLGNSNFLGSIV